MKLFLLCTVVDPALPKHCSGFQNKTRKETWEMLFIHINCRKHSFYFRVKVLTLPVIFSGFDDNKPFLLLRNDESV